MRILKILCILLAVLLVVLCIILGVLIMKNNESKAPESVPKENYQMGSFREYDINSSNVKLMGRSSTFDGKLLLSFSGSGLEYICKGDYTEITVSKENPYTPESHLPRFALYADGNLIVDECLDEISKTYRIDTSYSGTKITLIKLSEALFSSMTVDKIGAYSIEDIEPSEKGKISIEFIGDSITCGYGIDAGAYGMFSTETENFSKTYAYLTCRKLEAECSAVSFSGYGVVSGYTDNGYKTDKLVMNEYEKASLPTGKDAPLWDFGENEKDVVVVNLGTNDASYCSGSATRRSEFVSSYTELLETVRKHNKEAYILCILGDMNNSLYPSIESAVKEFCDRTGDKRVEAMKTDFRMSENDIVIDGHPGEKSNACAGDILSEKISSLIDDGLIGGE